MYYIAIPLFIITIIYYFARTYIIILECDNIIQYTMRISASVSQVDILIVFFWFSYLKCKWSMSMHFMYT